MLTLTECAEASGALTILWGGIQWLIANKCVSVGTRIDTYNYLFALCCVVGGLGKPRK